MPGGPVGPAPGGPPPGGLPRQMLKYRSNDFPVNREKVVREGREGSEGQSHKEEEIEGGVEQVMAVLGYLRRNPRVPSYATADEAGLPT